MNEIYDNDGIYKDEIAYGSPFVSKGLRYSCWANEYIPDVKSVLCVGCGNGYDVVYWLQNGKDAYGTELHDIKCDYLKGRIIKATAPGLPFSDKQFDLLMCCEVIEHIEPETSKDFILDCCRVSKKCLFSIATTMDSYKTHINLKTAPQWLHIFGELKLNLKNFQLNPAFFLFLDNDDKGSKIFLTMSYGEGVVAITENDI